MYYPRNHLKYSSDYQVQFGPPSYAQNLLFNPPLSPPPIFGQRLILAAPVAAAVWGSVGEWFGGNGQILLYTRIYTRTLWKNTENKLTSSAAISTRKPRNAEVWITVVRIKENGYLYSSLHAVSPPEQMMSGMRGFRINRVPLYKQGVFPLSILWHSLHEHLQNRIIFLLQFVRYLLD